MEAPADDDADEEEDTEAEDGRFLAKEEEVEGAIRKIPSSSAVSRSVMMKMLMMTGRRW